MNYDGFRKTTTAGRLKPTRFFEKIILSDGPEIREVDGYGYVPDELPAGIRNEDIAAEIQPNLLRAERNLSRLDGLATVLDNPVLLMALFSQKEARHSSAIENTFASATELALFDVDPTAVGENKRSEVGEVNGYLKALHHGFSSELPICLRLIKEMHHILLSNSQRKRGTPGEFRTLQNAIGDENQSFDDAKFVPTPPEYLDESLQAFEHFVGNEKELPRLVRFAMAHYQFECIHPFEDGNGRLGRLLVALQLCEQAQLRLPFVYVSGFFEQHRDRYYSLLYNVSSDGEWIPWIKFFLDAVGTQADDALHRAKMLIGKRIEYKRLVVQKKASPMLPVLIDSLFKDPAITIAKASEIAEMMPNNAAKLIETLVDHNILIEVTGRKRNRVYLAHELLSIVHDPLGD
mgnify:CR=1 FL=1